MKYLAVTLTKPGNDLYHKNSKFFKKKNEKGGKISHAYWSIGLAYIPHWLQHNFLLNLKEHVHMEQQKTQDSENNLIK